MTRRRRASRFRRLRDQLARRPGVRDPDHLAVTIKRRARRRIR